MALVQALKEIIKTTKQADVKGEGLLFQLDTFNFLLGFEMMDSILQMINKTSKTLQGENINLLPAMNNIKALRYALLQMRNEDSFKELFSECTNKCKSMEIQAPKLKKQKVSSRIDNNLQTTFNADSIEDKLWTTSDYPLIDVFVGGLDDKFNQETGYVINAVGTLLNLIIDRPSITLLSKQFKCHEEELETEIKLLIRNDTIPIATCSKTHFLQAWRKWLNWLIKADRQSVFNNFYDILKQFSVILITSCTCERSFSKLKKINCQIKIKKHHEAGTVKFIVD